MNISSAQYTISIVSNVPDGITVVIDGVTMFVPIDPSNRHYAEIMRQVEAGTLVIQEAE